jgi:uncharacterized protein (TIGR01244 family)
MDDPNDIRAWQRLTRDITSSGRLEEHDVARLAGLGVRHVINLALAEHPEALADEGMKLAAAGIGYVHIPVPFDRPDDSHFMDFVQALEAAPRPLHVHCIMNWRVSAFFYRWHCDVQGMAEAEARAVMEQQWSPTNDPHPDAPAWARFIAGDST